MFLATDALVIGLRAIGFVALFQAAGVALFLALYERYMASAPAERFASWRASPRSSRSSPRCSITCSRRRGWPGDFDSTFDPALESLLLRSSSGGANIARVVGLAILLLSLDRASRLNTGPCGGAALALLSFALMGHTVIHEQRWILAPLLLVHVVVAAVWLGGLGGLYLAARDTGAASAPLVARFSAHATWARAGDLRLRLRS